MEKTSLTIIIPKVIKRLVKEQAKADLEARGNVTTYIIKLVQEKENLK